MLTFDLLKLRVDFLNRWTHHTTLPGFVKAPALRKFIAILIF
jgi:hypothetical protein